MLRTTPAGAAAGASKSARGKGGPHEGVDRSGAPGGGGGVVSTGGAAGSSDQWQSMARLPGLAFLVRGSSQPRVEQRAEDSRFREEQQCRPGLLLVVPCGRLPLRLFAAAVDAEEAGRVNADDPDQRQRSE
jgi:hypothetical protein